MSEEFISVLSTAQRLGLMVEEVQELCKCKKLKCKKEGRQVLVSKSSVYAYSGLKEGRVSREKELGFGRDTNKIPKTDKKEGTKDSKEDAKDWHSEAKELFGGIDVSWLDGLDIEGKEIESLKDVARYFYRMGRLSVYEQMCEFRRR